MNTASIMNLNIEVKMKYKCLNNNDRRFVSKAFYDREIKLLENVKSEKKRSLAENSTNWESILKLEKLTLKTNNWSLCLSKAINRDPRPPQEAYCPHRGASRHL